MRKQTRSVLPSLSFSSRSRSSIALVTIAVAMVPTPEKRHTTDAADQLQTYLASADRGRCGTMC